MADHLITMPTFRGAGVAEEETQTLVSSGAATPVDYAKGAICYVPLTENTTMGNPTHPVDGARLVFEFANTAQNRTVAWGTAYKLAGAALTVTVGAKVTTVEFVYRAADSAWYEVSRSLNM